MTKGTTSNHDTGGTNPTGSHGVTPVSCFPPQVQKGGKPAYEAWFDAAPITSHWAAQRGLDEPTGDLNPERLTPQQRRSRTW
jgi:hypothetical protein